jgi:hypothetical protein
VWVPFNLAGSNTNLFECLLRQIRSGGSHTWYVVEGVDDVGKLFVRKGECWSSRTKIRNGEEGALPPEEKLWGRESLVKLGFTSRDMLMHMSSRREETSNNEHYQCLRQFASPNPPPYRPSPYPPGACVSRFFFLNPRALRNLEECAAS